MRTRRKRYSAEFKREALRRANEVGVTDVLVAEELGINAWMLRYWRDAAKRDGENAFSCCWAKSSNIPIPVICLSHRRTWKHRTISKAATVKC